MDYRFQQTYIGAYAQPYNPVLKKRKKKKKQLLDNPIPILQQYSTQTSEKRGNSQTIQGPQKYHPYNKTPSITSNKFKHNSIYPGHQQPHDKFPAIQSTVMADQRSTNYDGGFSLKSQNLLNYDQRIQQAIQEQKMLHNKVQYYHQNPKVFSNNSSVYEAIDFRRSGMNREQQRNSNQSFVQNSEPQLLSDINQESRSLDQSNKQSFQEAQFNLENKTHDDIGSIRKVENKQQYKLPSIRSNDSINRIDDSSRMTTIQKNNDIPNNKVIEESKSILMQSNRTKNLAQKFVTHNKSFIKELIDTQGSYRSTNVNFNERNSNKFTNQTPQRQIQQAKVQQNTQQDQELTITEEEKQVYGNRFPSGYKKVKLLGRGGCALVWLGKSDKNEELLVAVKQFPKQSGQNASLDSGYKELQMNRRFFQLNGQPYDAYQDNPGMGSLCKLLDSRDDKNDLWLIFEVCGKPLSKSMFEVKGEFFKGERIYSVLHRQHLFELFEREGCKFFKQFIIRITQVLQMFQAAGIVHSDLKPENILLMVDEETSAIQFKIIDLGSSFSFQKTNQDIELTTPEYLSPDILEYLENKNGLVMSGQGLSSQQDLTKKLFPWSIDIWSLGAILLEIVIGFPLWLSYKGRIVKQNQHQSQELSSICMTGLFGIQGRIPKKIKQKQIQTIQQLKSVLKKQFQSELCLGRLNTNEMFLDLLQKMLELNPKLRLSPKEILEHPFLQ